MINFLLTYLKKDKAKTTFNPVAYIRVDRCGSLHVPSSEIASLPEVKLMQKQAKRIVSKFPR